MQKMTQSEALKAITKYIPENQPSPGAYLKLINQQVLGVDKKGNTRPQEDLVYFLYVANRTGLDPLAKQLYAVYRWDYRIGAEKMTIQTSIDGLRLIAQRSKLYGGQDDVIFSPENENTPEPRKATVTVYKINPKTGERMPITASARWSEYRQLDKNGKPMGLWGKMPYTMLGKCAEALALRKGFPQEMSGIYIEEEMQQADSVSLPKPKVIEQKQATKANLTAEKDEDSGDGDKQPKQPKSAPKTDKKVVKTTEATTAELIKKRNELKGQNENHN